MSRAEILPDGGEPVPPWLLPGAFALGVVVVLLFLRSPGFGDDLDYWSLAFQLHERGPSAWSPVRFHDLRWPVWGLCWLVQGILGPGLIAFYTVPAFYMGLGASIAAFFGHRLTGNVAVAGMCALGFLFHPLLDTLCFRPMPDLSEGVLGALVVLGWWATMLASGRRALVGCAALTGLALVVLEANRITGAFLVPVLLVMTLVIDRRKFGRLVLIGVFAIAGYALLSAVYHARTGDWLHDIHANLRNKDAKGIESPPMWLAAFRFIDNLWDSGPLAHAFFLLGAVGIWRAWRHHGQAGRIVVLWFAILLLTYSCAPQRLWPYKPMLRDTDRFLAALTIPMSVLAALGLHQLLPTRWTPLRPAVCLLVLPPVLLWATERPWSDLRTVREMRQHVDSKQPGTRILSHARMRNYTHLVAYRGAHQLQWVAPDDLLQRNPAIEAQAADCEELWYLRQLLWLNTVFRLDRKQLPEQPALPSFFESLHRDWVPDAVFVQGDKPDLVFYRRRNSSDPAPLIMDAGTPPLADLVPPLPFRWQPDGRARHKLKWKVPADWRGRMLHLEMHAASPNPDPCEFRLIFSPGEGASDAEYLLKPHVFPTAGKDFFAFPIPASAEKCEITATCKAGTNVEFADLRVWLEARRE